MDVELGNRDGVLWSYRSRIVGRLDGKERGGNEGEIGIVVGDDRIVALYITTDLGSLLIGNVVDEERNARMMNLLRSVEMDWNMIGWFKQMLLFEGSMALLMAWMKKGVDTASDEEIIESHRVVMEGITDADFVNKVELATGKNLREQMSVRELEELMREMELLKMGNKRN